MEEQFQSFRKDSPYGTEGLAYTGFSDRLLVEHLNGNIHYQLFCGIMIAPSCPITNYKIISAVRNEIASRLDIDFLQGILASHWKPYLENLHVCMTDITCYESHMPIEPFDPFPKELHVRRKTHMTFITCDIGHTHVKILKIRLPV